MDLYHFDQTHTADGHKLVCGIDEAGRGPLAGPVVAAAVILPCHSEIQGLGDSKKLSAKKREALYEVITQQAVAWAVGWASHEEIDEINILQATFLAMNRAVGGLAQPPDLALVDGNRDPGLPVPAKLVTGGDGKSACIAAASILAKVTRDRWLAELDARYPEYDFARHKGYGTKLHYQLLDAHGPSPVHRRSFLRKWEAARSGG